MTTNHIDTLAEWWSGAEHAPFREGDMLISRREGEPVTYEVYPAGCDHNVPADNVRILARAPKPTPAWHNAVAVIAHTARFSERRPFALTHTEDVLDPYNSEWITRDDLIDPVPLIEQKVTGEMVERAIDRAEDLGYIERVFGEIDGIDHNAMAEIVTAALGLETA